MKYEKLKRQVIIEASIIGIVVLVMAAIVYLISAILDDYEASNDSLQKQVDVIDMEMKNLRAKYSNIKNNLDIYQEVQQKQADGRLAINRQMVLEKFNQYKNKYALSGLHMIVSQPQDVKDAVFKRPKTTVNFSDVTASFEITSDESVYELVDSLRGELPGISKMIKLNMTLQKPFNEGAFEAISHNGAYPMIKTEMRFIWFGINPVLPPEVKPNMQPMPPNMPPIPPNMPPNMPNGSNAP